MKSLPVVTFEAILANIDTQVHLYKLSKQQTYNHRAVSTLAAENFFSTLASTSPTGCPCAADIPQIMLHVVSLNHFRHLKPDELGFFIQPSSSSVYPLHTLDSCKDKEPADNGQGLWKNHQFDFETEKRQ